MAMAQDKFVRGSRKVALDRLLAANRAAGRLPASWYGLGKLIGLTPGNLLTVAGGHRWAACERVLDAVAAGATPEKIRRLGGGLRSAVTRRRNGRRARKGREGGQRGAQRVRGGVQR